MSMRARANDLSTLTDSVKAALDRRPAQYFGGAWHGSTAVLPVVDPSSGKTVAEIARGGSGEIDTAVAAAKRAFRSPEWTGLGPVGREHLLLRLAQLIEERSGDLATVETVDNGMPIWLANGINVPGAAGVYRYFAGWPTKLTGQTMEVSGPPGTGDYLGFTRREPLGVIGAIVPWNVPFMLAAWKLAPALAAGCTIVLKPAEDASLSALALAELVELAGFPAGVVNIVTGLGSEAGEALVTHPDVTKISFTGSTATGKRVAALAGTHLKRVTLELGGKSPTIIFDDADLDAAIPGAANAIFFNSGQVCVAGSRLYVQDRVYDAVLEGLNAHIRTLKVGPGLDPSSAMGPLISARQYARVAGYVDGARARGCEVLQGHAADGDGFYFAPTIVTGAGATDMITQEEVFGPVLSVYRFGDAEEALAAANGTPYGLAASVWSRDVGRVLKLLTRLECGKVSVNAAGFPYPALPEGGWKASGHGRDLGQEAVEQCLQTKSVLVRL